MGWVVNAMTRQIYPLEKDPEPIIQGAGWAPGPVWKGAENLAHTNMDTALNGLCIKASVVQR